jgi:small subunit ribosomal protein S17
MNRATTTEVMTTRKTKTGVVTSDAMDKTVVVEVERTVMDPVFKKYVRRRKKFMAHDEENVCKRGDIVEIRESRPLSKRKRWRVTKLVKKEALAADATANV